MWMNLGFHLCLVNVKLWGKKWTKKLFDWNFYFLRLRNVSAAVRKRSRCNKKYVNMELNSWINRLLGMSCESDNVVSRIIIRKAHAWARAADKARSINLQLSSPKKRLGEWEMHWIAPSTAHAFERNLWRNERMKLCKPGEVNWSPMLQASAEFIKIAISQTRSTINSWPNFMSQHSCRGTSKAWNCRRLTSVRGVANSKTCASSRGETNRLI